MILFLNTRGVCFRGMIKTINYDQVEQSLQQHSLELYIEICILLVAGL